MTTLRAGSATHVGQVRATNQDAFLVIDEADLYGVADGMGGHNGGEVAAAMAVESLQEHAGEPTLKNLMHAARIGNRAIFEKAGNTPELHGMGTTLCAVRVVPGADGEGDEIAWINVGDSRIYLFRDDNLIQLSRDHSLVEDLLRDGQLTEDEAKVHPKRNIITRALGIDLDVEVDGSTVIPFNGDRFLLCSDGLFGEVTADQIASVLRRLADPTEAADELVRLANEAGGRDNITVVLVEVVDDDGRSLKAAEALEAEQARLRAREEEAPGEGDEGYVPVFADRRSSLPDADAGAYAAESDDPFTGIDEQASRRVTWRVVAFLVTLLALVLVVVGSLVYFDRQDYRVAASGPNEVVIYRGNPNGFLFLSAPVVQRAKVDVSGLDDKQRQILDGTPSFKTRAAAIKYLAGLQEASPVDDTSATSTTSSTSSTSTSTSTSTTSTTSSTTTTTAPAQPTTTTGG